ncbi:MULTISPECIES: HNH endonuclease [unclassified Streptomyces]|uniref:HNH endonuclease signature motif containing protein n=1 Tax=unclassified Streptomyces TaxID=2593676 RepID=UPI003D71A1B9
MNRARFPRETLATSAAVSTSLVDLLRHIDAPLTSQTLRYVRSRLQHYGIDVSHFVPEPLPPRERQTYSREVLADAAARSTSIREVLDHLGVPVSDSLYGHIRKKLERWEIDTSHFTSGRGYGPRLLPAAPLAAAVAGSSSMAGVLNALGLTDNTTSRTRVRLSLDKHRISTHHFTGQAHRRGLVSPHRKPAEEILRRQPPGSPRTKTVLLRRALDDLGVPHSCAACGLGGTWQGRLLVLEIDHINGDDLDNRLENLRYLCPSCHSQTRTHSRPRRTRTSRAQ